MLVVVICALTNVAACARAQFQSGHLYVTDRVFRDGDILEYDANFNYVGSFKPGLQSGNNLNLGGGLRFGPDGHLYNFGELIDTGGNSRTGIFDWSAPAVLANFYPTPGFYVPEVEGFDVLPNGHFIVADLSTIRDYARDFATFQDYTITQGGGWQGVFLHNGAVFVVGVAELGGFDTGTRTQNFYYGSMTDNADLSVRADGVIALNYQFHDNDANLLNGTTDSVELLNSSGTFLKKAFVPDPLWTADGGLAFGLNGGLFVPSNELNPAGSAIVAPHLALLDSSFNYLGSQTLAHWREAGGIAIAQVPEPGALTLFGACALTLGVVTRRRIRLRQAFIGIMNLLAARPQ